MTTINAASPADSEAFIFGSGALSFSWWQKAAHPDWEYDENFPFAAPDDWMWNLVAENPHADSSVAVTIRHKDIMAAARKIMADKETYPEGLRKECRNLLFRVDEADFDAGDADCVLQVAVYGEVHFG